MENLLRDLHFAVRQLLRRPLFAAIAIVSLALGTGANTAVFSLVDQLFLAALPIADAERVAVIYLTDPKEGDSELIAHLNWKDLREQSTTFAEIVGYEWVRMNILRDGAPSRVSGQMVSGNYFETLGVQAEHGRTFSPEEDGAPGAHPVVVLSHRYGVERFGEASKAVGETLRINDHPFTVIGVAPPEFKGVMVGTQPDLWIPIAMNRVIEPEPTNNYHERRIGRIIMAFGRLAPGVSLEAASAELGILGDRLAEEFPDANRGRSYRAVPIEEATIYIWARDGVTRGTTLLMATAALVLLIACVNLANLLLARASERRKEIAVRLALGIGRGRLVRQLMSESLLIAFLGGLAGLVVALWVQRLLFASFAEAVWGSLALEGGLNPRALVFTTLLTLFTSLVFGLIPALQASRPELVEAIKGDGASGGKRRLPLRHALVVGQLALSLIALAGAGLFIRSFQAAGKIDPGFEKEKLAIVSFDLSLSGYTQSQGEHFLKELEQRADALPGVRSAALAQFRPLEWAWFTSLVHTDLPPDPLHRTDLQYNTISPGYFETMGISIEEGREFQELDREGAERVIILNRTTAEHFFPGERALGQRLTLFHDVETETVTVVGVARDAAIYAIGVEIPHHVYLPMAQHYVPLAKLIVRTENAPAAVLPSIRHAVQELAPELLLDDVSTISGIISKSLWAPRLAALFLGIFGVVALALAAIGLYAVMAHAVNRRRREIGIRVALGAAPGNVFEMVFRQSLGLLLVGLALGFLGVFQGSRLVTAMLYVESLDPAALFGAALVLLTVGCLATLEPARRALGVDPIEVLRQQ